MSKESKVKSGDFMRGLGAGALATGTVAAGTGAGELGAGALLALTEAENPQEAQKIMQNATADAAPGCCIGCPFVFIAGALVPQV
jgi:hypothetical protein